MAKASFGQYNPPVKDHTDKTQVIHQGLDPKIAERIGKAERGELKARLAAILDRGIIHDRLVVELPDDLHGEWVRNDPLEINRLKALGFTVDTEHATKRSIHSDGSDSAIVGDVIHMICPKEVKETIDEIRLERMIKEHAPRKKGNKEEEELLADIERMKVAGVSAFTNSKEKSAGNRELADLVNSIDNQTKKFEGDKT